jgi:hypothetical protein
MPFRFFIDDDLMLCRSCSNAQRRATSQGQRRPGVGRRIRLCVANAFSARYRAAIHGKKPAGSVKRDDAHARQCMYSNTVTAAERSARGRRATAMSGRDFPSRNCRRCDEQRTHHDLQRCENVGLQRRRCGGRRYRKTEAAGVRCTRRCVLIRYVDMRGKRPKPQTQRKRAHDDIASTHCLRCSRNE